jgi:hypothetical protein
MHVKRATNGYIYIYNVQEFDVGAKQEAVLTHTHILLYVCEINCYMCILIYFGRGRGTGRGGEREREKERKSERDTQILSRFASIFLRRRVICLNSSFSLERGTQNACQYLVKQVRS